MKLPALIQSAASRLLLTAAVLLGLVTVAHAGQSADGRSSANAAILASAETYVQAFNRGDAEALAAMWTNDGSLIDQQGNVFQGRQAIEEQYAAVFTQFPQAKIEISVGRVEFPTTTTAVEDGFSRVVSGDGSTGIGRYTAVHVFKDGRWLMASVRESTPPPPSGETTMQRLDWLIGTWQGRSQATTIRWTFRWAAGQRFIQCEEKIINNDGEFPSGTRIIGWDSTSLQVRSWSFDASGGRGTGVWSAGPDGWRIRTDIVAADGTLASMRELLRRAPGDDDAIGCRRAYGSSDASDSPEIVLKRLSDDK